MFGFILCIFTYTPTTASLLLEVCMRVHVRMYVYTHLLVERLAIEWTC